MKITSELVCQGLGKDAPKTMETELVLNVSICFLSQQLICLLNCWVCNSFAYRLFIIAGETTKQFKHLLIVSMSQSITDMK